MGLSLIVIEESSQVSSLSKYPLENRTGVLDNLLLITQKSATGFLLFIGVRRGVKIYLMLVCLFAAPKARQYSPIFLTVDSSWESGGRRGVRCGWIVKGFLQTYAQGHALVTSGMDANRRSDLSSTVSKVIYRYTELYGIFIVLYRLPACLPVQSVHLQRPRRALRENCLAYNLVSAGFYIMETFVSKVTSGKKLHSQEREIILRVSVFMLNETIEPNLIPLKKGIERTAAACGVSVGVVKKIRKEKKDLDTTDDTTCSFATPKRKKRSKIVTDIDDFDKCVIRRKIYNFYKSERSLPSLKFLKTHSQKI
ncbi:hypothetical protein J6590_069138 [Homalodisca vitripennis]|nr:hypothetical protein J6590_069138 [Homalodisca vitripennis]